MPSERPTIAQRTSFVQRGADYFGLSGPAEFITAAIFVVLMIALRIANLISYRFDSDESQHLHVVWAWAHGFVQYRDIFDNHMPLFHIMFAPVYKLIGERPAILYWMRFIMLPLYFVAAWCTYRIGTLLFSRRAGIWAVVLVGFYPAYHFISLQFRTDNVWALFWLLCVTVLMGGELSARRALKAGLLLGLCFAVSMKSSLFLVSILVAAPLTVFVVGRERLGQSWSHLAQCAAAFLVTTLIVPAAVIIFFALEGVWRDFRYCVFDFNVLASRLAGGELFYKSHPVVAAAFFLVVAGICVYIGRQLARHSANPGLAVRRAFVFFVCASYFLALESRLWPLLSHDNDPPFYPLVFVLISGVALGVSDRLARQKRNVLGNLRPRSLIQIAAAAEVVLSVTMHPFWKNRTKSEADLLRDVLALTTPADYVFDCKGETVFRTRCFRPVLEKMTVACIRTGVIVDNAPQRCIDTRTCVVATELKKRISLNTRRFLKHCYLPVAGNLRVAGAELQPSSADPYRFDFEVVIPASYEIIYIDERVRGTLDGIPCNGARFLGPGRHTFESESTFQNLFLLWAPAVDRHFTPYHRVS
ncbi:MAG: glycosyltransferase family 39 protein [Verrucomicrobiota bacterium]